MPWLLPFLATAVLVVATHDGRAATNSLEFLPEIERVLDGQGGLTTRSYLCFSNGG